MGRIRFWGRDMGYV